MSDRPPIALITGGSGSLGRATAKELAQRGYDLMLLGRDRRRLRDAAEAAEAAGKRECVIEWTVADVRSSQQMRETVHATVERFGRLDALLAFAGYERDFAELMPLRPSTAALEAAEAVVATDLLGTLRAVFAVEPLMRERGGGTIITLGTTPTIDVRADHLLYQVARAGVRQMVECLAEQHRADGADGVRVLWLALGSVFTPATYSGMTPAQRRAADQRGWLNAETHVAPLVASLLDESLARPDGATIRLDAKHAPMLFRELGLPFEPFLPDEAKSRQR